MKPRFLTDAQWEKVKNLPNQPKPPRAWNEKWIDAGCPDVTVKNGIIPNPPYPHKGGNIRMFGRPDVKEMLREELEYSVEFLEKERNFWWKISMELMDLVDTDTPLPKGIGHWDGITRRQNQAEGGRRREVGI